MNKAMYKFLNQKGEHLHTLDGKPLLGTSTVVGVMAKPLTWWASGLACKEFGWTNGKETPNDARIESATKMLDTIKELSPEAYLALLDRAYSAHSKSLNKSATKGTDMHAELETYIKVCLEFGGGPKDIVSTFEPVKQFSNWAMENVKKFLVSEGYCYSRELWVGGITDCMAEMKDGSIAIIDFKSSKDAYDSQFVQVAGYDLEQSENGIFDADGLKILDPQEIKQYFIIPFGAKEFKVEQRFNIDEYKEGFKAATTLYKLTNHEK